MSINDIHSPNIVTIIFFTRFSTNVSFALVPGIPGLPVFPFPGGPGLPREPGTPGGPGRPSAPGGPLGPHQKKRNIFPPLKINLLPTFFGPHCKYMFNLHLFLESLGYLFFHSLVTLGYRVDLVLLVDLVDQAHLGDLIKKEIILP